MASTQQLTIGAFVFQRFELLDLYGPLEMLGYLEPQPEITIIAQDKQPVTSSQGPKVYVDQQLADATSFDIFLIPGGMGTRTEVSDPDLIQHIKRIAEQSKHVLTVCTGAALLAKTGLLNQRIATTNKRAFDWVAGIGDDVKWDRPARWVVDGKYVTSAGISAGIDMSLAFIERLYGKAERERIAAVTEYKQ